MIAVETALTFSNIYPVQSNQITVDTSSCRGLKSVPEDR